MCKILYVLNTDKFALEQWSSTHGLHVAYQIIFSGP
jgi:hypothetical protein